MAISINGITVAGGGKDGKTAYQAAVEGGYEGTEKEFNALLGHMITTENGVPSAPIPVDADTLGGKPADQYVTKDTTINNKPLSENIALSAEDVGARPNNWMPTSEEVGAAATSHIHDASDVTTGTFPADRIPDLDAGKITSGILPITRGGTGVSTMEGTDYSTFRPRGIVLQSSIPESIPNGCIVGVYE